MHVTITPEALAFAESLNEARERTDALDGAYAHQSRTYGHLAAALRDALKIAFGDTVEAARFAESVHQVTLRSGASIAASIVQATHEARVEHESTVGALAADVEALTQELDVAQDTATADRVAELADDLLLAVRRYTDARRAAGRAVFGALPVGARSAERVSA